MPLPPRIKCNCTTCPYIEHGLNQCTFHSTAETHHIKSHITCETFNVICLIQCRLCNLQYIGETKRRLKDRFNEHRRPILNPTGNYIHTAVSEHRHPRTPLATPLGGSSLRLTFYPFTQHVCQKRYPSVIPFIDKWSPFSHT